MLSKFRLKYLVYRQVFWVKVRHLQGQCISVWTLVFNYWISNNLSLEKTAIYMNYKLHKCFSTLSVFLHMCCNKINIFLYKKSQNKKYLLLLFDLFSFFIFLSLFSMFFFCILLCQANFRWLPSFFRRFFSYSIAVNKL